MIPAAGIAILSQASPDGPWALAEGDDLTEVRKAVAEKAGVPLSAARSITVKCPSCAEDPVKGPIQAWLKAKGLFAAVWLDA